MKSKMKIVIIVLLIIAALPLIIGLFLPNERIFTKTALFKSSPQQIWEVITDIKGQEAWRSDVKSIEMIHTQKGAEKWTEIPKKGKPITFQVKAYQPPNRFDIEIVESDFSGYWEGRFEENHGGTKVELKEVAIVKNPYFRTLAYLFFDLNQTMDLYLANLKTKLGE
ncbi:MAG: SRPBCC family protein [Flammeovirgaceae bacterium]